MTAAFPQIGISDGIEVIEIDDTIRVAIHHGERDPAAFHDETLIDCSGARGLEERLAKTAVCACNRIPEKCLRRFTENASNESVDFYVGQLLLACKA